MALVRQLLAAKAVGGHHLDGQWPGVDEATRVKADLGDHSIVWHHHRHWSEERLSGGGGGGFDRA